MKISRAIFYIAGMLLLMPLAQAASWQTERPTAMYDAPSQQAKPLLILSGRHPLVELSKVHGWHKVTTYQGETGWVASDMLQAARSVVVVADRAAVRVDPHAAAAAIFFARRGVVLDVLSEDAQGWLKVVHQDGDVGYIQLSDSWKNF
ncbi:MAG: hypothetical protein K0U15_02655 [Proteobacteria bacterium]|nr:hypothetical protein [Pseudomonadota bacterium]